MLFLTNIDMDGNEIQNVAIQNLDTEPSNPKAGQIIYNSTTNKIEYYNGTEWISKDDLTIQKLETSEEGYSTSYQMTKNGSPIGDKINIPKDLVVQSGSVKTVESENTPVEGYVVGNKYIDLLIANSNDEHIYILVSDLVEGVGEYYFVDNVKKGEIFNDYVNNKASGESSHAEGAGTTASGDGAHAEGNVTKATGNQSHAEGFSTQANGVRSHAEGAGTRANGKESHAEGAGTQANGVQSHAEGINTTASGSNSHAEGNFSVAIGSDSHAEGRFAVTKGNYSHAEGSGDSPPTITRDIDGNITDATGPHMASGNYSHIEGYDCIASGSSSHAEGTGTKAIGSSSHAEGRDTISFGINSHAEGYRSIAKGSYSHAEGGSNSSPTITKDDDGNITDVTGPHMASGDYSHVEGHNNIASGINSHAEGNGTKATGAQSHAEGAGNQAIGSKSHAEGTGTTASGSNSHAEGNFSVASGSDSHAEGRFAVAKGNCSHAEGGGSNSSPNITKDDDGNITDVTGSHMASGDYSHIEGHNCIASGSSSHAEGTGTKAIGSSSHAGGSYTIASGEVQTVIGKYNVEDTENKYAFIIGNGDSSTRSNVLSVSWDGSLVINNVKSALDTTLIEGLKYQIGELTEDITITLPESANSDIEVDFAVGSTIYNITCSCLSLNVVNNTYYKVLFSYDKTLNMWFSSVLSFNYTPPVVEEEIPESNESEDVTNDGSTTT